MKIEIEYNGAYAICTITDTFGKNPDAKMQFAYADKMSQIFALDAFKCIKECWDREQKTGHLAP